MRHWARWLRSTQHVQDRQAYEILRWLLGAFASGQDWLLGAFAAWSTCYCGCLTAGKSQVSNRVAATRLCFSALYNWHCCLPAGSTHVSNRVAASAVTTNDRVEPKGLRKACCLLCANAYYPACQSACQIVGRSFGKHT